MPEPLSYLIQNCLHDPRGDAKVDISSKELEENFEFSQVDYLKARGLLESVPAPSFLRCSECGRSCTAEVIRDSGRYFLFCEDQSSRRLLEPKELERWRLSLTGLGGFIAQQLKSAFRGNGVSDGIEVCMSNGLLYELRKNKAGWFLQIEDARVSLIDVFCWHRGNLLVNKNKISEALNNIKEYQPPRIKWTNAKLQELVNRKAELKLGGEKAFLQVLAKEYGCTKQALQKQLIKAEKKGITPERANPFKV